MLASLKKTPAPSNVAEERVSEAADAVAAVVTARKGPSPAVDAHPEVSRAIYDYMCGVGAAVPVSISTACIGAARVESAAGERVSEAADAVAAVVTARCDVSH